MGRWIPMIGLLALLSVPLPAQVPIARFGHLTVEDGLPHSAVSSIHQGSRGFLWLGTQGGLCRWDGHACRVFRHDPADPSSLPSGRVGDMAEDGRGDLWLGTLNGLARFDRELESFESWTRDAANPKSLPGDLVLDLMVDRRGELWVGTVLGVARFDRTSQDFAPVEGLMSTIREFLGSSPEAITIGHLYEDRRGDLWVGTYAGLLRCGRQTWDCDAFRHDPGDPTSLSHDLINGIAEDGAGRLWVATGGGLNRFLPESRTFERFSQPTLDLSSRRIFELLLDRRGDLWVGTANHGLVRIPGDGSEIENFLHDPGESESLIGNRIIAMAEDQRGNLWFGTYVGASYWAPGHQQFATYRQRPGRAATLTGNNISALLESDEDTLWVGTWDRGLNRLDRRSARVMPFHADPADPESLPDDTITSLLLDRRGDLWVGTWGGLARYDSQRNAFERIPLPESGSDAINSLYEDAEGWIWVGHIGGLARLDPLSRSWESSTELEGAGDLWVDRITGSSDGSLWLVGNFDFPRRLAPGSARFEPFRPGRHDDRCDYRSHDLLFQEPARLWTATDRGVVLFDLEADRSTCYPTDWLGGQIVSFAGAADGSVWMGSERGLKRLDPQTGVVESYGVEDGLQASVFSSRSAFASPRGELFFGGIRGFNAFWPDRLQRDEAAPSIVISGLQVNDRPVGPRARDPESPLERSIVESTELVLDHRQTTVTFELAALDLVTPKSARYAYRMDGLEDQWVETDAERRFARYVQLPPGRYTFQARAGNRHGAWGEVRVLRIVVEPAPWRSPWAYLSYALLLALMTSTYVGRQRRKLARERAMVEREREINLRLREMDRFKDHLLGERQRLVDDLRVRNDELAEISTSSAHDLINPLTTIQAFLGSIRRDRKTGREDRIDHDLDRLDRAARGMRRMLQGLHEIARIVSSTPGREVIDLETLVRGKAEDLGLTQSETELSIAPDLPAVTGDAALLGDLFEHLLSNAMEHASPLRPLRVEIEGGVEGERLGLEVRDNGKGVDPRYHQRVFKLFESLDPGGRSGGGLGLSLARRIVELHGGQIRLESAGPDQGARVLFDLPLADVDGPRNGDSAV